LKELLKLFYVFFKLGLFTFGGGYAMIPQLKEQAVEKHKWLQEEEMLQIIAIAESTPGPIAINMATYIGFRQKKFWGSFFATLGVVLPSLIIIFLISLFFNSFLQNEIVTYAFVGIKCAVAFLILKTGISMLLKMKKSTFNIVVFLIAFLSVLAIEIFAINFSTIFLILFGGILGLIVFAILQNKNKKVVVNEQDSSQISQQEGEKKWFTFCCFWNFLK